MVTIDTLRNQLAWNLDYAEALTADVPSDLWARSGGPGLENHPAWTIGHLVTGRAMVAEELGIDPGIPAAWVERLARRGPDDTRRPAAGAYPSREQLMGALRRLQVEIAEALLHLGETALAKRREWRFDGYLPTTLDVLVFMLIAHESVHLGQLGCWRRRFGLTSAMASMGRGP